MFAECFHDNLAFAATLIRLATNNDDATLPADTLADTAALAPMLAAHGRDTDTHEPRALASQWSKFCFARLIIPSVVIQCSHDRAIDFATTPWRLTENADGTPGAFVFARDPLGAPGTGHDFSAMIDTVMQPVTATLCSGWGLSPRVYASNAAMYYAWAIDQLAAQARGVPNALAAARALTATRTRPDGGANPFHAPFKTLAPGATDGLGEPTRECRRLCCVRDLDPAWDLCSNCPRAVSWPATAPERRAVV